MKNELLQVAKYRIRHFTGTPALIRGDLMREIRIRTAPGDSPIKIRLVVIGIILVAIL